VSGEKGESNAAEVEVISRLLEGVNARTNAERRRSEVLVITPYSEQEMRLRDAIELRRASGHFGALDIDVCTLDRCQGREAEHVFISLVRGRATVFLDMPKRWNVALTRAMQHLIVVGDIDAYLEEARRARRDPRAQVGARGADGREQGRLRMSLLARVIEQYSRQIAEGGASVGERA
jgi:superfamily I DNA and/or RNA helicase